VSVAPLVHQRLKFGIVPIRQHDAGGDVQIGPSRRRLWQPLALQAKGPALDVFFGMDNSTALPRVGTRTLPPSTAS